MPQVKQTRVRATTWRPHFVLERQLREISR